MGGALTGGLVFLAGVGLALGGSDNFANATVLSGALPISYPVSPTLLSNAAATAEVDEPAHDFDSITSHSLWYQWTAPGDIVVEINTFGSAPIVPTPGIQFDTVLAVYTGSSVDSLTRIIGSDDNEDISNGNTKQSRVRFVAKSGTTYRIAVDGFSGATGNVQLNILQHALTRPSNDDWANAAVLTGPLPQENDRTPTSTTKSNFNATVEHGEPEHVSESAFSSSVWYAWTATTSGSVAAHTTGSSFDTVLAAYRGNAVGSLTLIAANDDNSDGSQSTVLFFAQLGVTYYFAVDGFDAEEGDVHFKLEWGPSAPPNDNLASAQQLPSLNTTSTNGPSGGATKEFDETDHVLGHAPTSSIWYYWISPADVSPSVEINTFGSNFDTVLAVYTGDSYANLSKVASNDDAGSGQSRVRFNALPSTTYRIAVDGKEGSQGAVFLNLLPGPTRPSNDDFANAQAIAQSSYTSAAGTNLGATVEVSEQNHASGIGPEASVWFRWTANADSKVQVSTANSTFDTVLAVYEGASLATLTQLASNDNAGGLQSLVTFSASTGQSYYIAVAGKAGAEGTIALSINAVGSYALWLENWPSLTGADRAHAADKDGDGYSNSIEILCGLNPTLNSRPGGADPNSANAPAITFQNQINIITTFVIDPSYVGPSHNGGGPISFAGIILTNGSLAGGAQVPASLVSGNTYRISLGTTAEQFHLMRLQVRDPNR